MRVLFVTCGLPFPANSGTRIRDFNLIREVSKRAEVYVFSLLTEELPEEMGELLALCKRVEVFKPPSGLWQFAGLLRYWSRQRPLATLPFYSTAMNAQIRSLVETEAIDVVQVEHSFLACYRNAIPDNARCAAILSFHNIGFLQYRRIAKLSTGTIERAFFLVKAALMRGWEARIAGRFNRSLVVSSKEDLQLRRKAPALRTAIIGNGVDCQCYQLLEAPASAATLLFVGVLDYPPNRDAVFWLVADILPEIERSCPGVRLCVAGLSPPPSIVSLQRENVEVKGFVDDLMPIYRQSTVAVVPLRAGGGTRLKILEAMALGRTVVSTSIGCEGLDVVSGEHLLIADSAQEFAAAVVRALHDGELRRRLAANARKLVEAQYCWTAIAARLFDVYEAVCEEKACSFE